VRHTEERFWMLETIREFAVERLEESGEAEGMRRRHADHFLLLAEEAARHDLRWNPGDWLDVLASERDNVRAGLDFLEAGSESELFLRLAAAMWRFWQLHDYRAEGKRWLESALRDDKRPSAARASALNGAAVMALEGGDSATAKLRAEEALALYESLGDARGIAFSTVMVGDAMSEQGDFLGARRFFEESNRLFRDLGDENYALATSRDIAGTYADAGDRASARSRHEENLLQARATGKTEMQVSIMGTLALYALEDGRVADALSILQESLPKCRDLGNRLEIGLTLRYFARALALTGKPRVAARILSASEAVREEIGFARSWFGELDEATLAPIRSQLDQATFDEEWTLGSKLTDDQAIELALESED
jgi:non-specific serine/threonine protein kinase